MPHISMTQRYVAVCNIAPIPGSIVYCEFVLSVEFVELLFQSLNLAATLCAWPSTSSRVTPLLYPAPASQLRGLEEHKVLYFMCELHV